MSAAPRVSILIPAYRSRFFAEAFASARAQAYRELEIVVCDDSADEAIATAVGQSRDARVRYVRNPSRLGFAGNFARCLALASGDFIKFLNDDDRLRPGCVAELAGVLAANPAVRLATSRRVVIDEAGAIRPDVPATLPLAAVSALLHGRELGDYVLANSINFIGEPSTVLFPRAALALEGDSPFRWGGHDYHCLADLSMWLRLLGGGLAYYGSAPLSEFRIHADQEQHGEQARIECLRERLRIVGQARGAGFLASPANHRAALERVREQATEWVGMAAAGEAASQAADFLAAVEREIGAARL